jgi:hypothetical protein
MPTSDYGSVIEIKLSEKAGDLYPWLCLVCDVEVNIPSDPLVTSESTLRQKQVNGTSEIARQF